MAVDIPAIIRERALANGVDPDLLLRKATVESNLDPYSANPRSSAKGLFQFTDSTWKQYGQGADPFDPVANADAGARFLANNQRLLKQAGVEPTAGASYLAHFAGPGGALKVLRADPNAPVSSVLDPAAVKANPFLAKMTVADLRSWADNKMGNAPAGPAANVVAQAPSSTPSSAAQTSAAPGADSIPTDTPLPPQLMAMLQKIPAMLEQQNEMPEPPQMDVLNADPIGRARRLSMIMAQRPVA